MKKFSLYKCLLIGQSHSTHCEDYLLSAEIGENKFIFAIFDGCSSGNESFFAAALMGKILKKIAKERAFLDFVKKDAPTVALELYEISKRLFEELKAIKNLLLLDKYDLLSTLVLAIYDSEKDCGTLLVAGDAIISVNGEITVFDQQNKPDYLAYHLEEDFEFWYANQKQIVNFQQLKDLSIASDGILSFDRYSEKYTEEEIDILDYLLKDTEFCETDNMLLKKCHLLQRDYGLKPMDDLSIIRLIKK